MSAFTQQFTFCVFCTCALLSVPVFCPRSVTSWSPATDESHQACTVCLTDVCLLCWLAYFGGQRLEMSWIIHRNCLISKVLTLMCLCFCRKEACCIFFSYIFAFCHALSRPNVKQRWRFHYSFTNLYIFINKSPLHCWKMLSKIDKKRQLNTPAPKTLAHFFLINSFSGIKEQAASG